MIYWYSGTGNSRHAARRLSELIHDSDLRFIPAVLGIKPEKQSGRKKGNLDADSIGFVFPVYSWGVPPVVLELIGRLDAKDLKERYVWAVLTCGDEAGLAAKMFQDALKRKGIGVSAIFTLIMPNDYVMLPGFSTDSPAVASQKIKDAEARLKYISGKLSAKKEMRDVHKGSLPWLKTKLVYPLFRRFGVQTKRWKVDADKCISCGKCAAACPAYNIHMEGGRPKWKKRCFSCTACFHVCPRRAIDYGSFTKGKPQYYLFENY